MLREFLKNKGKRHKRNVGKKLFSRKLGGTHNNQKNYKNKAGKSIDKSRNSKNVKSNKTK